VFPEKIEVSRQKVITKAALAVHESEGGVSSVYSRGGVEAGDCLKL
jgi:hypothetical protein